MNLKDYFYYDETSRTFLRWKVDIWTGRHRATKNVSAGDVAGSLIKNSSGRIQCYRVSLNRKTINVHRIIWELIYGDIPKGMVIDHLDGNPLNNNIRNLKCKTQKHNSQNKTLSKSNKSGHNGIHFHKRNNYFYIVAASIKNGKIVRKSFPVHKLGYDKALSLALLAREDMISELNSSGEDYNFRYTINPEIPKEK